MLSGIAFIIDPPMSLQLDHDSSLAMILACHHRNIPVAIIEGHQLFLKEGSVFAYVSWLLPTSSYQNWNLVVRQETLPLKFFDCVLMRKDPPCDLSYIHLTHFLSLAKREGVYIVNDPDSLRLFHEKWVIEQFPHCIAPTLVSSNRDQIKQFIKEHQKVVLKPLDGMGGRGIFVIAHGDPNTNSILETMLGSESRLIMAQEYLDAITEGDKRILVIHGEAFPFLLARIPSSEDFRGNLAAGGRGVARPLSDRDIWLVEQISPFLMKHGLNFVGLDVIGDYMTEINITSPTCVREIDAACGSDVAGLFIEGLLARIEGSK